MAVQTAYPNTVTQTTGGKYASFSSLANIKNASADYAITSLIKGKSVSPNRPSTLTCTNFHFTIPTGSRITSIKVEYRHKKDSYNGKSPGIPSPTITLLGVTGYSKTGKSPNLSMTTNSVTFTPSNINSTTINSSSFGVKINYPANKNAYNGYLRVNFIRITINYLQPSYTMGLMANPTTPENGATVDFQLQVTNKNLTDYKPTITITTPSGWTLIGNPSGDGTLANIGTRTYTWKPNFNSKKGSINLGLKFEVNVTGTYPVTSTFTAVESLTNTTKTLNISVTEPTGSTGSQTDNTSANVIEDSQAYLANKKVLTLDIDEEFNVDLTFDDSSITSVKMDLCNIYDYDYDTYSRADVTTDIQQKVDGEWVNVTSSPWTLNVTDGRLQEKLRPNSNGQYAIILLDNAETNILKKINLDVKPTSITTPFFCALTLTEEELNRLGDGFKYVAQAFMEVVTDDGYVHDWGSNCRIGVYNNSIEGVTDYSNLTLQQVYENTQVWSKPVDEPNKNTNLDCEFTYDDDYPLYILICGDYPEADTVPTIKYSTPNIIESSVYNGQEPTGNYPNPILNIIANDGESSEVTIESYGTSTPVVMYDFNLEEDYSSNEKWAIRGIGVMATIEDYSPCILRVQLVSPLGESGERSIKIDENSHDEYNRILIGGLGDTWGFTTNNLNNLEGWSAIVTLQNILTGSENSISLNNAQMLFYIETITQQKEWCVINGEDIRYYGAFLQNADIPFGLKTETSYLDIDGTDTNDSYRQNIRGKDITLELSIGDNCNLKTASEELMQLTQLLINKRDKYNRPIPKRIEFSHLPGLYFEYIIEDTLENPIEISSYSVKAKLSVPSGTAFKENETVTSSTGNVQGLAKVRPVITIKPTGNNIELRESESNQTFNITYPGDISGKIIEIDCDNRKVYLLSENDDGMVTEITSYVDFNSDWFALQGEYVFTCTNAYIRTVSYIERW